MGCVWWHKTNAQPQAGLEQYYSVHGNTMSFTPMLWYQSKRGWYAEARYNFEAANSVSLYAGKTFEKQSKISYSLSTIGGIVMGDFKGGSIAVNADAGYKRISVSLQSQYTFSAEDRSLNYIYIWSDISLRFLHSVSAGFSLQQTNGCNTNVISEKGIFIKAEPGKWVFPLYIFNPLSNERYMVLGINYTWQ